MKFAFFYSRLPLLSCLLAFLLPLKLSLSYIVLIPSVLGLLLFKGYRPLLENTKLRLLFLPFFSFLLTVLITGLFGIRPLDSLAEVFSLTFYAFTAVLAYETAKQGYAHRAALCLLAGQSLASLHTLIDKSYPETLPRLFLGDVTESGQLALSILLGLGMFFTLRKKGSHQLLATSFFLPFLLFLGSGFLFRSQMMTILLHVAALGVFFCILLWNRRRAPSLSKIPLILSGLSLPLLFSALLLNLKRGPLLGVFLSTLVFLFRSKRQLLIPLFALSVLAILVLQPLQERILSSLDHFYISGGRSAIWEVGLDLLFQYPLGIGFGNSNILANFSSEIPPELQHFHSNFLNIFVEVGALGLALYLWWIFRILRFSFSSESPLIFSIGCAILSSQIAGLVEYNVGDSEVFLLVLFLSGLMAGIPEQKSQDPLTKMKRDDSADQCQPE